MRTGSGCWGCARGPKQLKHKKFVRWGWNDLHFSLITFAGPILGIVGLGIDVQALFWIGVIICAFNLFMNLASGVMNFPLIPGVLVVAGGIYWSPWFMGAALGLVVWTGLEALGELYSIARGR